MSPDRYAAALLEAVPDGTYGQAVRQPQQTETVLRPWTPAEQKAHRDELCDAFGFPNDYDPKPNPRRKRSN